MATDDVVARLETERSLLGAHAVILLVVSPEGTSLLWGASTAYNPELAATWDDIPLTADLPSTHAFESGRSEFHASMADLLDAYPDLVGAPVNPSALAVVPIAIGRARVGVWIAELPEPYAFSATRRAVMTSLAADWAPVLADRLPLSFDRLDTGALPALGRAPSEHVMGRAFESLVVAAASSDVDGRFTAVNAAGRRLLGRSEAELLATTVRTITHPDDWQLDEDATARLRAGEPQVVVRKRFVRPDGSPVTVDATVVGLTTPVGRWAGTLAQYAEVQRADILELTASAVFEALPVGVAVVDFDHRYVRVNPAMEHLTGHVAGELAGRSVREAHPPALAEQIASILDRVARSGRPAVDVPLTLADESDMSAGTKLLASSVPVLDTDGATVATAIVVADRTAESLVQDAEERRLQTIDALLAAMPIPVALLDRAGRFVHVNAATSTLGGVKVEDHIGRTARELYPPNVAAVLEEMASGPRRVQRRDLVGHGTGRLTGRNRHFHVTAFPVLDGGWGFTVDDRTELDAAHGRVQSLADLAGRLASATDAGEIATATEQVAMAQLGASRAGVVVAGDGALRLVSLSGGEGSVAPGGEVLGVAVTDAVNRAVASRDAVWLHGAEPLVREGVEAVGVLPLVADGVAIGALVMWWTDDRMMGEEERRWSTTLAGMLAQTLVRAQEAERDRHTAETLQRSLLPSRLDPPPWLDVAAAYRAAGHDSVGGDLYDLVLLDDGRVALVVADICGRGITAAAATAVVRHTVRAALLRGDDAVDALADVDRALHHFAPADLTLATALVAMIEPPGPAGALRVSVTLAGHAPALVRRAKRGVEPLGIVSPLLGVEAARERRPTEVTLLWPGDVLVAYTDGLTDSPDPRLSDVDVADRLSRAAPSSSEHVLATLLASTPPRANGGDDTAIIVARPGA